MQTTAVERASHEGNDRRPGKNSQIRSLRENAKKAKKAKIAKNAKALPRWTSYKGAVMIKVISGKKAADARRRPAFSRQSRVDSPPSKGDYGPKLVVYLVAQVLTCVWRGAPRNPAALRPRHRLKSVLPISLAVDPQKMRGQIGQNGQMGQIGQATIGTTGNHGLKPVPPRVEKRTTKTDKSDKGPLEKRAAFNPAC